MVQANVRQLCEPVLLDEAMKILHQAGIYLIVVAEDGEGYNAAWVGDKRGPQGKRVPALARIMWDDHGRKYEHYLPCFGLKCEKDKARVPTDEASSSSASQGPSPAATAGASSPAPANMEPGVQTTGMSEGPPGPQFAWARPYETRVPQPYSTAAATADPLAIECSKGPMRDPADYDDYQIVELDEVPVRKAFVWATEAYGHEVPPVPRPINLPIVGPYHTRWIGGKSALHAGGVIAGSEGSVGGPWWSLLGYTPSFDVRLVEARPGVIDTVRMREHDVLYAKVDVVSVTSKRQLAGGVWNLPNIETLQAGPILYRLEHQLGITPHGEYYLARLVEEHRPRFSILGHVWKALGRRYRLTRLAWRELPKLPLTTSAVPSFPDEGAQIRLIYQVAKPLSEHLPHMVGPITNLKDAHLGLKNPLKTQPIEVIREALAFEARIREHMAVVPAFGHPPQRKHKSCVSCGASPPAGKYRWKHRVCKQCQNRLNQLGYTTWSGSQIQENLHVPTCYPGIVYVGAKQYPPPESKWEKVEIGNGATLKINRAQVPCPTDRVRGKRWDDVVKADLASLWQPDPPRFRQALCGIGCSGANPMVSAPTAYTQMKAVCCRLFREVPKASWGSGPRPGRWEWAKQFVPQLLPDFTASEMTADEWIASMPSHRRKALTRAKVHYEENGMTKSAQEFGAFIKTEFLPGFVQRHGTLEPMKTMVDRIIQAPADVTHVIAGPVLKPLIPVLKERWAARNPIFYGSCSPEHLKVFLDEIADGESCYFWSDFVQFENSHSSESWAFMEWLYGDHGPAFGKVMELWRKPRGKIGPFKYQARVMNASGRDDTALANAVLNGFATMLSCAAAFHELPLGDLTPPLLQEAMQYIRLSVCGDDSLGKLPLWSPERLARFKCALADNIREFGFNATIETSYRLQDCVYLGMRPYPVAGEWLWGKTIGRATYKLGWSLQPQARDLMAHITGVADMHVRCSSHVPILSDLAHTIVRLREGAKRTPVRITEDKPWEWTLPREVKYDGETLKSVADLYGSTVNEVVALIKKIRAIERLPAMVDDDLWRRIIATDEL
jgi:hypothetical protein